MPIYKASQSLGALRVDNVAHSEKISVTCAADLAGAIAGKYFQFNSPSTGYYCYLTVDGAGSDPAIGGRTAVPVAITELERSTVTTVADVAGSLGGKYFLLNSPSVGYYVWLDVDNGSSDPEVAGRTGLEVDISADASANAVASAIQAVLDAHASFVATVLDDVVTVTNAAQGNVTNIAAGDSGFAVAVTRQGGDGSASTIASAIATAVDAVSGVAASASGGVVTIVADATGDALNASDGNTGYGIAVSVQGQPDSYGPYTAVSSLTNTPSDIAALT